MGKRNLADLSPVHSSYYARGSFRDLKQAIATTRTGAVITATVSELRQL